MLCTQKQYKTIKQSNSTMLCCSIIHSLLACIQQVFSFMYNTFRNKSDFTLGYLNFNEEIQQLCLTMVVVVFWHLPLHVLLQVVILKFNQRSMFCWEMWLKVPMWLALWQRTDANVQNWVLNVPMNWGWMQKNMNTEPDLLTSQCCPPQPSVQKTDKVSVITVRHDSR